MREGQGAMGRACRTMSIIKRGAGGKVGQLMMISLTPPPQQLSAAFPFQGTTIKSGRGLVLGNVQILTTTKFVY